MNAQVVVVGAGGFGRETLDVLAADSSAPIVLGVIDDAPRAIDLERLADREIPYLGTLTQWAATATPDVQYILAIGDPSIRRRLIAEEPLVSRTAATAIHPTATFGTQVQLGDGAVVCAGAHISTNVQLGVHAHVGAGAIIGHDTMTAPAVSINPGAVVSGSVTIGEGALIGAGSTTLQELTIGSGATIGAAACVTRDVRANSIVKGIPAR